MINKVLLLLGAGMLLAACNQVTPVSPLVETPTATGTVAVTPSATAMVTGPKTVIMTAQNGSGQSGTVTLEDVDGKLKVIIKLSRKTSTPEPAHIHVGSCPNPGAVKYPLTNVVNGNSVTTLDLTLSELMSTPGPMAVNVHQSAQAMGTYFSCGDIK